jgi:LruC domain-containing protein
MESLNLGNNTLLESFWFQNNQISSIDISNNTLLLHLHGEDNQLNSLDITNNSTLNSVDLSNNQLERLNASNGNNEFLTWFMVINNPNLTCIQVDDAIWSTANWPNKDATASYSEDCGWGTNDSDGDGIADNMDDYPQDANKAFDNYFPAAGFGSLAFEDLWPGIGDYDFNDVVVDYQFLTITNSSNKVVGITGTFAVKASGASMENGFGFNLPDANSVFASDPTSFNVSGYDIQESYIALNLNGHESGQSKPTIIVFDNIYNSLPHPGGSIGVNTEISAPFVPFDTIVIRIQCTTNQYSMSDFSLESWNPFIIINQDRGIEIHLPDHAPTDLADITVLGTYQDDSDPSIGRYYKTENNLPWAIDIVSEFSWPTEKSNISDTYLHFQEWAESSGTTFMDWYIDDAGYFDESKIYAVP